MDEAFKIYIEQLRDGREKKIKECFPPDFLEINEDDLVFKKPVELEGVAYLAENELVLHWKIQAEALIACAICNELVKVPIIIENFYYSEPLAEITSGIYHLKDLLRETILLELPTFAECNQGHCPKRQEFTKYLRESSDSLKSDEGYHPFADLDWKL